MTLSSGTAKPFRRITEDRIVVDHTPPKFIKIYIDDRQSGDAMREEAVKIQQRILNLEKLVDKMNENINEVEDSIHTKYTEDDVANILRGILVQSGIN